MVIKHNEIARFRKSDKKIQSIKEHTDNVVSRCSEAGSKIGMESFAKVIAYLHDMGKYQQAFQDYIKAKLNGTEPDIKETIDHGIVGAKYLYDTYHKDDMIGKITSEMMAMIIAYHHGGLNDFINYDLRLVLIERLEKPEALRGLNEVTNQFFSKIINEEELSLLLDKAKKELLTKLELFKKIKMDSYYGMTMLLKCLYSCLIDADRCDAASFEDGFVECEYKDWGVLLNALEEHLKLFKKNKDGNQKIRNLRASISDRCKDFALNEGGIYTLTVPTGGGKTLASFRYALSHAYNFKDKQRIFYIIPYITILEQNAAQIREAIDDLAYVLEHHSNIEIDNNYDFNRKLSENWDTQIILTSMVQFLNSFYTKSTQDTRRVHNLTNSVIIIDEIQSVPIRCINLLNSVINFLAYICNSTVILCTATQPSLNKTKRPILMSYTSEIIPNQKELYDSFKRVEVVYKKEVFTCSELANYATDLLEENNSILIIMNTKKSVERLYKSLMALKKDYVHVLNLTTYMCPAHRSAVINTFKKLLKNKEKVICVSTQLIEAGVDVSADCVIRSLAGIDSIAQAAGRCNRHGEHDSKNVYVVKIADSDEDVSRLADIRDAQRSAVNVLNKYSNNPGLYDNSLLSPKAIGEYYDYFYYEKSKDMDFPVKKYNSSIYNMLSSNQSFKDAYNSKYGMNSYSNIMGQAVYSAGEEFFVIEKNTRTVIVPYGKGVDIIAELNSHNLDLNYAKKLLREAQKYSVSLYSQDIMAIGEGIYELENGLIYALNQLFYNNETGVTTDGGVMDLCNI